MTHEAKYSYFGRIACTQCVHVYMAIYPHAVYGVIGVSVCMYVWCKHSVSYAERLSRSRYCLRGRLRNLIVIDRVHISPPNKKQIRANVDATTKHCSSPPTSNTNKQLVGRQLALPTLFGKRRCLMCISSASRPIKLAR